MTDDIKGTHLLAVEPLPVGSWVEFAQHRLLQEGRRVHATPGSVLTWGEERVSRGVRFADGQAITRLWLTHGVWALAAIPRRVYFSGSTLDQRPEREIVGDSRPPGDDRETRVSRLREVLDELIRGVPQTHFTSLDALSPSLATSRVISVAGQSTVVPPASLNTIYRNQGFERTPDATMITIVPVDGASDHVAQRLLAGVEKAGKQRGWIPTVRISELSAIARRVMELHDRGEEAMPGRCLLFLLPKAKEPASDAVLALMKALESVRVPFRRCYADDPFDFSIADQLPSLLQACGGMPHASSTGSYPNPIWTIGIDLGHPLLSSVSRVALALVSPDGELAGAWVTPQRRDETVSPASLGRLLKASACMHRERAEGADLVVMRDGRHFSNEAPELYESYLGSNLSVLECRKRGNPQMMQGEAVQGLKEAVAAKVPGCNTIFLVTAPPRLKDQLPNVLKVAWEDRLNRLQLEPEAVAELLTASAAAPGLGLHPRHLPAALYWADGIASASDCDLRFRGVPLTVV